MRSKGNLRFNGRLRYRKLAPTLLCLASLLLSISVLICQKMSVSEKGGNRKTEKPICGLKSFMNEHQQHLLIIKNAGVWLSSHRASERMMFNHDQTTRRRLQWAEKQMKLASVRVIWKTFARKENWACNRLVERIRLN